MVVAPPNNTTTGPANLAKKSNLKFVLRNNRKAEPYAVTNTLKKVTIINNNFSADDEVRCEGDVAPKWQRSIHLQLVVYWDACVSLFTICLFVGCSVFFLPLEAVLSRPWNGINNPTLTHSDTLKQPAGERCVSDIIIARDGIKLGKHRVECETKWTEEIEEINKYPFCTRNQFIYLYS